MNRGAVLASTSGGVGHPLGQFLLSLGIGVAGAAAGVAVLWVCLCKLDLDELLATTAQLATVVGVAAACDIVRDDAGLIAAVLMGLAVANLRAFHVAGLGVVLEQIGRASCRERV